MNDYLYWVPSTKFRLFDIVSVQYYEFFTWLTIILGSIIWLFLLRNADASQSRKLITLGVTGVAGVLFTRLFHIIFWEWNSYMDNPSLFFQVKSGRSVHGSLVAFAVAAVFAARYLKQPVLAMADKLAFWPLLGLVFARIGNFIGSEMIGTPTTLPFAVRFYYTLDRGAVPRHPVVLYEAAACALLLVVVLALTLSGRLDRKPGFVSGIVLVSYSALRFATDFIRQEPGYIGNSWMTTGQWLSIPFFILGIALLAGLDRFIMKTKVEVTDVRQK